MIRLVSFLIAYLGLFANIQAQYNKGLDTTFGNKGIVLLSSPSKTWMLSSGVVQPDGKILAIGGTNIIRLKIDGSLDHSFANSGIFDDTLRDDHDTLLSLIKGLRYGLGALTLQTDNKIIVVGTVESSSYVVRPFIFLFRLLPNGTFDSTFGRNGIVCNPSLGHNEALDVAIQPDGKILVLGDSSNTPNIQMLARYLPNGKVDSSFGINGKIINPLAPVGIQSDIVVMPDGRILAMYDYFGVARYLSNGNLDTTFNHTGIASVFSGFSAPYSHAMVLQPDGKIYIAGHGDISPTKTAFILARLNSDGSIDSSLGGIGYTIYPWDTGSENKCHDMLQLPDGRLILGGAVMNKGAYNFGLIRVNPNSTEDSSFGDNARLLTAPNESDEKYAHAYKLLLQKDNKIVALGISTNGIGSYENFATAVRYTPNGTTFINEIHSMQNDIILCPNPSNGNLVIARNSLSSFSGKANQSDPIFIKVYDLLGRVVFEQSLILNKAQTPLVLNLAKGTYILELRTEDAVQRERIVIND